MPGMKNIITHSLAVTSLLAVSFFSSVALADEINPFGMSQITQGYQLAGKDGKCGEGKCGANKSKAEGKCGASKAESTESKCGASKEKSREGKCGDGKGSEAKAEKKEGKCGEGKCGGKS